MEGIYTALTKKVGVPQSQTSIKNGFGVWSALQNQVHGYGYNAGRKPNIYDALIDAAKDPYSPANTNNIKQRLSSWLKEQLSNLVSGIGNLIPEWTTLGKLIRGDASEVADFMDTLSGNKIAYDRALEDRAYQEGYNDPVAQVSRMLAAGLNPYFNGGSMSPSDAASADIPSSAGFDGLPSLLYNGLSGAIGALGNIPEKFVNLRAAQESIKSQRLDNLQKEWKLGADKDLIKKQLRKMDQDWAFENEKREEDRQRFSGWKDEQIRAAEEHLKKMITYDDNHQIHLHNVSQWETDDLMKLAQLRAVQLSNNSQEFVNNYINQARLSHIVAETNSLLRMTNLHEKEFNERVRQFDLTYEQAERWKQLDDEGKAKVQALQERLLAGQISHLEYTNTLEKYGLKQNSPRFMKQDAGLVDNLGNTFNNTGANILDAILSLPNQVLGGLISM